MKPVKKSSLYFGTIYHKRFKPKRHAFSYRVFSMLIDLDEITRLDEELKLFSYNSFNLFSFHDKDHGPRNGTPLKHWVHKHCQKAGIDIKQGAVKIHCFPRVLGYVFNPLSIFFCYNQKQKLKAVIYEVKNTFGEQHCYLIPVDESVDTKKSVIHQHAGKKFYVSPFIDMDCDYQFRLKNPDEKFSLVIDQYDQAGKLLLATHHATRAPLTHRALLKAFFTYPLLTVKVIGGIHFEAFRLWLKGIKLVKKPDPPASEITYLNKKMLTKRHIA